MRFYKKSSLLLKSIWIPLTVCAVLYCICELLNVIGNGVQGDLQGEFFAFAKALPHFAPFLIVFFVPYKLCHRQVVYKALWCTLCFAVYGSAYWAISEKSSSIFASVLLGVLFAYIFNKFPSKAAFLFTAVLSFLLGAACGYLFDLYENMLIWILNSIGNRGSVTAFLFGFLNHFFELISSDFKTLVYEKSYGGAVFIDGAMATGAKHIFEQSVQAEAVHTFLSGRLVQLFTLPGMALAVADALKGSKKHGFILLSVCAVLSGNMTLFFIFVLLESPFLFLAAAFLSALCYLTASLLQFTAGFYENGGAVELILYLNKNYLLLLVGVAFMVLSYFLFQYCILKYDVSERANIYIPKRLQWAADALGGVHNIIRFKEEGVEVRNVKRIDTLRLDGEMKENLFCTDNPQVVELAEYLC